MIVVLLTATAIKNRRASKDPREGNQKPEAMTSSVIKFREKNLRPPLLSDKERGKAKGNETLHIKNESGKMLVSIESKGEVRDPEQLTSDNDFFCQRAPR